MQIINYLRECKQAFAKCSSSKLCTSSFSSHFHNLFQVFQSFLKSLLSNFWIHRDKLSSYFCLNSENRFVELACKNKKYERMIQVYKITHNSLEKLFSQKVACWYSSEVGWSKFTYHFSYEIREEILERNILLDFWLNVYFLKKSTIDYF